MQNSPYAEFPTLHTHFWFRCNYVSRQRQSKTDGRCGCLADADCGSVTSGRVCDASTSRCVPGCRGTGGNGCVNEMVCSSTTDEIGGCRGSGGDKLFGSLF